MNSYRLTGLIPLILVFFAIYLNSPEERDIEDHYKHQGNNFLSDAINAIFGEKNSIKATPW